MRRVYLLPSVGGVGVESQLQMLVVEVPPATGLGVPNQGGMLGVRSHYTVAWKSSNTSVASVNQQGVVTGLSRGEAVISATVTWAPHGPVNQLQSKITVGPVVATLECPDEESVLAHCTKSIKTQPKDGRGLPLDNRPVTWQSDAPQVVSIRPPYSGQIPPSAANPGAIADSIFFHRTAIISGNQVGQVFVTATCEGVSVRVPVSVLPGDPTSLKIYPDHLILDVQETAQALVVAHNENGCLVPNASVTWNTADPTIAIVNQQTGEVRGLKAGTTQLTATTQSGLMANIAVTVPAVAFIVVDPGQIRELDIEARREIVASPCSLTGVPLANRHVTWSVSNSNISLLSGSGYTTTVIGKSPGDSIVTASSEGVTASLSVTVPRVASMSIAPSSANVSVNSAVQLTAKPVSSLGTPLKNRTVSWHTSDPEIALQNAVGYTTKATGKIPGDATVIASSEGVSATAAIHVRTFCEDHPCAPYYVVENYSNITVDVYQIECTASDCSPWRKMITVPPGYYWVSSGLVENNAYQVRAIEEGGNVNSWSDIKGELLPFIGGPGNVPALLQLS